MTFEEIEKELLMAPLRIFSKEEMRGYFAPELRKKFNITEEQIHKMLKMRRTFRWKFKTLNGEQKYFFFLR